jgi:hypothetical protein
MPSFAELAQLRHSDVRSFDTEQRQVVEELGAQGWRGYVSRRGHAILMAPDGHTTTSVSRSGGGRRNRAARTDLERWKRQRQETVMTTTTPTATDYSTGAGPQRCPECDRTFKHGGALALHRQRVHGMTCPECGERFVGGGNAVRYAEHRTNVHDVPPTKRAPKRPESGPYPCPTCGRIFETSNGLNGHLRVHQGTTQADAETTSAPQDAQAAPQAPDIPTEGLPDPEPKNGEQGRVQAPIRRDLNGATPATAVPDDLEAWLASQDSRALLAQVLAVVAPPLAGHIERLVRERDELRDEVARLTEWRSDQEARMALLREAMNA